MISFIQPNILWFLAIVPALLVALFFLRTRPPQSWLTFLVRLAALALLIIALAEPTKEDERSLSGRIAVVDVSDSVRDPALSAFVSAFERYLPQKSSDSLSILPFARSPGEAASSIRNSSQFRSVLDGARRDLDRGASDIGRALLDASAKTTSANILLITDGQETTGDARAAVLEIAAKNQRVFPIVVGDGPFRNDELEISSLYAPLVAQSGDLAQVRLAVHNPSKTQIVAPVELWLDQQKLYSNSVTINPGQEKLISVKTPALEGGLKRIRAQLGKADKLLERYRWISVKNRSRILLLSGTDDDERLLRRLLTQEGYATESIVADGRTPIPTDFSQFPLVILNNAAKKQLPGGFLESLQKHTAGGGGLILIGGDRSYGLGGYIDTPLEQISPVRFVPPKTTQKRLNSAVVLLIDKSKSMRENDKIEAARRAAVIAIDALKDDDYVGVIGFDDAPFELIPIRPVSENRALAQSRIRHLYADGRTRLRSSLQMVIRKLQSVDAARKHVILLSDGEASDALEGYASELSSFRQQGITLTTIALGVDADAPTMKMLAREGRGAFYHTFDPSQLPEVFLEDIKVTTGEKTIKERERFPVQIGPGGLRSTTERDFPPLTGYVETRPKSGSAIELELEDNEGPAPLLVSGHYEKGKVVAFTSDAHGRWSAAWAREETFGHFWKQIVESVRPSQNEQSGDIEFDFRPILRHSTIDLEFTIYDEKLLSGSTPPTTAIAQEPSGGKQELTLVSDVPGKFTTRVMNARPGDYRIEVKYGQTQLPPVAFTLVAEDFGEKAGRGIDYALLEEIARRTGGSINPDPAVLLTERQTITDRTPLFPYFVLMAALLIVMEALIRELGLIGSRRFLARRQKSSTKSARTASRVRRRP